MYHFRVDKKRLISCFFSSPSYYIVCRTQVTLQKLYFEIYDIYIFLGCEEFKKKHHFEFELKHYICITEV